MPADPDDAISRVRLESAGPSEPPQDHKYFKVNDLYPIILYVSSYYNCLKHLDLKWKYNERYRSLEWSRMVEEDESLPDLTVIVQNIFHVYHIHMETLDIYMQHFQMFKKKKSPI